MSRPRRRAWEVLESREVFAADPWIRVQRQKVRLPDDRIVEDYHRIDLPDFAIVFAETGDGEVLVERGYRHGVGGEDLTLPAGAIDAGEAPLAAAQRELLEETGFAAQDWRALGTYTMNGNYGCGRAHLFHARGARRVAGPRSGDLEEIDVLLMPRAALLEAIGRGDMHLLGVVAVVALALLRDTGSLA